MPLDTDIFSDREIVAKTAWGEFRNDGREGMQSIVNTVQNRLASRVRWWGDSLRTICLKPYQYSCWLQNDPNRPKIMAVTASDPQYQIALGLADAAIGDELPDLTSSADSYFDTRMPQAPAWSVGLLPVFKLGPHAYYKTVEWSGS